MRFAVVRGTPAPLAKSPFGLKRWLKRSHRTGRISLVIGGAEWHRTAHGLRVHGASRWWARSRAARRRCSRRFSRAPARSSVKTRPRRRKLLLRQIPTVSGDIISGFVDLALERAFVYKEHAPSEVVPLEGDALDREKTARFSMLETLADHDDELMEQLLEDIQPPRDKIFDDLSKELRESLVSPPLLRSATRTNGVLRLMKALRHESPGMVETAKRLGVKGGQTVAYVLKTINTAPRGKLSAVRVLSGKIADGANLMNGDGQVARVAAVFKLMGQQTEKRGAAEAGDTVALGRLHHAKTRDTLSDRPKPPPPVAKVVPHPPVLSIAVVTKERKDDVKLGHALAKLLEADSSISVVHNAEAHEVVLLAQGEMQLRVATERLAGPFGLAPSA